MAPKGGPCGFCFLAKGAAARQQAGAATRGATLIYALLAQLVEQLTLNQRAQGSSPWKCTIEIKHEQGRTQSTPASVRFGKAQSRAGGSPVGYRVVRLGQQSCRDKIPGRAL